MSYSARTLKRMRGHPRTWAPAPEVVVDVPQHATKPVTLLTSGWAPPSGADPLLPFKVLRTTKGLQVPVYSDFKNGRTRKLTIVRKIIGDEEALAAEIHRVTGGAEVTVRPGRIEVMGDRRAELKNWLMGLGF